MTRIRARFNHAMGLEPDGFLDSGVCPLPKLSAPATSPTPSI